MSARRLSLVAVLLVVPMILSAQKRGGGGGGSKSERGKMTFDTTRARNSGLLSPKDLEKENMVGFVLDKKKDLKLSDDEVKALKGINDRLKDSVSVAMNSLDSIASRMRRTGEKAGDGIMRGRHLRMRQPGHDAEVLAEVLDNVQVRRHLIIGPGLLRKEKLRMHAKRRAE